MTLSINGSKVLTFFSFHNYNQNNRNATNLRCSNYKRTLCVLLYYTATTRNFINSISVIFVLLSTHFIKFNCIATKRKCIHSICKLLCGFIAVFSLSFSLFTTLCKPSYKFSRFFFNSLSQTDPYCLYFSLSFSFAWGAVFM